MLTKEQNEQLTRVGPGTPGGELMRRYWHPIAAMEDLDTKFSVDVRLLGEDLTLFRDRTGKLGLIGRYCPHRGASFTNGIPTEKGIRCPYHGWEYDAEGNCTEQPNEPKPFCDKVATKAYPVEELGGMIWAYMGPLPAPMTPHVDGLVHPGTIRMMGRAIVPVNWLQCQENSLDPIHTEWLHGQMFQFVGEQRGVKVAIATHHEKIAFKEFEYGITKHRVLAGHSEEEDDWTIGHPIFFPNWLSVGNGGENTRYYAFQIRVPMDDENTLHVWYTAFVPPRGVDVLPHLTEKMYTYEVPWLDENGDPLVDNVDGQDLMAWVSQGRIADRTSENLGWSDQGIAAYRRMLMREIKKVQDGEEPMNVFRDPATHQRIDLPNEKSKFHNSDGLRMWLNKTHMTYSPIRDDVIAMYEAVGAAGPQQRFANAAD